MKKNIFILCLSVVMLSTLSGCFAGKSAATPGRGVKLQVLVEENRSENQLRLV